jgi:hypothetical protein
VLGVLLVIAAIYLLVIAIIARHVPVIVTSAVGLEAIVTAAVMGVQPRPQRHDRKLHGDGDGDRGRPGLLCRRAVRRASTRRNVIILAGSRAAGRRRQA